MMFQFSPPTTEDSWAKRFSAYGALFVTTAAFLLLFVGLAASFLHSDPLPPAFSNLMETVKALAMMTAAYWVGSSKSSQDKDATIAVGTAALAVSVPVGAVQAIAAAQAPPAPDVPQAAETAPAAPAPPPATDRPLAPSTGAMHPTGVR